MTKRTPPEGFEPDNSNLEEFGQANSWYQLVGPLFHASDNKPGDVRMSFFSEQRYISSMGRVHGGKMSSFMDYLLFTSAHSAWGDTPLATISLTINFVSACPANVWVEGHGRVVRAGTEMAFVEGKVIAEGKPIVHGTGTFKKLTRG